MKKYFIHEVDDEGWSAGTMTNNLMKDFIKVYDITWDEEFEGDDSIGQYPDITNLKIGEERSEVWIYEIDPTKEKQHLMGRFNFFTNCDDDVLDFIQENYRRLEMEEIDESIKIHRFNNYK
jgi:hypothetical protein